jgi:hypothetical protein
MATAVTLRVNSHAILSFAKTVSVHRSLCSSFLHNARAHVITRKRGWCSIMLEGASVETLPTARTEHPHTTTTRSTMTRAAHAKRCLLERSAVFNFPTPPRRCTHSYSALLVYVRAQPLSRSTLAHRARGHEPAHAHAARNSTHVPHPSSTEQHRHDGA